VSTTARNRRIFAWYETGPDLRVLPGVWRAHGGMQLRASCDKRVGRRRPRIPFTRRNKPLNRAFPFAGRNDRVMAAAGLVVTDVSHLGVGLNWWGRFPRAGSVCCVEQAQEAGAHDVIAYRRGVLGRRVRLRGPVESRIGGVGMSRRGRVRRRSQHRCGSGGGGGQRRVGVWIANRATLGMVVSRVLPEMGRPCTTRSWRRDSPSTLANHSFCCSTPVASSSGS